MQRMIWYAMHHLLQPNRLADAESLAHALLLFAGSKHAIPGVRQDKLMQDV